MACRRLHHYPWTFSEHPGILLSSEDFAQIDVSAVRRSISWMTRTGLFAAPTPPQPYHIHVSMQSAFHVNFSNRVGYLRPLRSYMRLRPRTEAHSGGLAAFAPGTRPWVALELSESQL